MHDIHDKIHLHTKQDSRETKELLFAFYEDLWFAIVMIKNKKKKNN